MNGIGSEIITTAIVTIGVNGTLLGALAWFIAHWMSRIETKVDQHTEERMACRTIMGNLIKREEFSSAVSHIHQRLDEDEQHHSILAQRVAGLEVVAGK